MVEVSSASPPYCMIPFQPVNVVFPCQIQTLYAFCMKASKLLLSLVSEKECAKQKSINCITMWDNVSQTCQSGDCS